MAQPSELQIEIAATAARLIAEDGLDYATAKRKAAQDVLGEGARQTLPDNAVVEQELRRYLQTFEPDRHPQRLAALRALALEWMEQLAQFEPHLVGAVLNGTATEHSDVHLHLFTDDVKEVEMFLLNAGFDFEVDEGDDRPGGAAEILHLLATPPRALGLPPRVGIVLSLHAADAVRMAPRFRSTAPGLHPVEAAGRANLEHLRHLLADRRA
jgi:hypothetical protein